MKEASPLQSVREFHELFGHPVLSVPQIPAKNRCDLRVSLLQEELNELSEAIEQKNIVEIADALCDLQYVLSGAILEFGLASKFPALFDEVHRSNMSKACATLEEAERTQKHYKEAKKTDSYIKEVEEKFLVYRTEDDKTLKSINYSPADFSKLI